MKFAVGMLAVGLSCSPASAADLPAALTDADFRSYSEAKVRLGRLLFYDRVLSGTYRVSCATCHNHDRASSNGFRLDGKEEERDDLAVGGEPLYEPFKPSAKHAPPLFNLGAKQFRKLFGDGRVEQLADGSFRSPAGDELPDQLTDVLAVQALFPAVQSDELVGTVDNDLTKVAHKGSRAIWAALAARVSDLPDYWPSFRAAYPEATVPDDITIVEIANAIGAFVGTEWRSDDTPFDRFLRGDEMAMNAQQKRGMELFYGSARCSSCHAGALQTDHSFHRTRMSGGSRSVASASAMPDPTDEGRRAVTGLDADRMAFRTPSLRNVARTAPYGRLGEHAELGALMAQHLDATKADSDMPKVGLSGAEVSDLIAFLSALTDEAGVKGKLGKPAEVPSSLALD